MTYTNGHPQPDTQRQCSYKSTCYYPEQKCNERIKVRNEPYLDVRLFQAVCLCEVQLRRCFAPLSERSFHNFFLCLVRQMDISAVPDMVLQVCFVPFTVGKISFSLVIVLSSTSCFLISSRGFIVFFSDRQNVLFVLWCLTVWGALEEIGARLGLLKESTHFTLVQTRVCDMEF